MIANNEMSYRLKVTLLGSEPPIWRRFLVKDFPLANLHEIIQEAMGWENCHLYHFTVAGQQFGDASVSDDVEDAFLTTLADVVSEEGTTFHYLYDYGDNWEHEVLVEKIGIAQDRERTLYCLDGERACPPEDVGGIPGYLEFLRVVSDPNHTDHMSMLEWFGGSFDAEMFDVDAVNRKFAMVR